MDADRRPPEQSVPAQLTRRSALGLAAAVVAGSLATSTQPAAAGVKGSQPAWAAALTDAVSQTLARTAIVGAIVGVWQDDQPLYRQAFGVRDTATRAPMTPDLYMR